MNTSLKTMIIGMLLIIALPMAKLSAQVSVWDGTWEPWTHGTGTEADPLLIENARQLAYLAYRVNNGLDAGGGHVSNHDLHYKLMVDVDLNGSENFQWTPIGYYIPDPDSQSFGGYFDGNYHTISGLYINSFANRVGFFGNANGATIQNLNINGYTIATAGQKAGGVVGVANNIVIMNCNTNFTEGVSASSCAGGIVGYSAGTATITNCQNTGTVLVSSSNDYSYSGGIVGQTGIVTITNCHNTGTVLVSSSDDYSYSGGIVGNAGTAIITKCYNTGTVSASSNNYSYSGGIVGKAGPSIIDAKIIADCYNTGTVSAS